MTENSTATIFASVSPNAKDSNDGSSPDTPVRTLDRALTLAAKHDGPVTVKLTRGRFEAPTGALPSNIALDGGWNTGLNEETKPFAEQSRFTTRQLRQLEPDDDLSKAHTCLTAAGERDRVLTIAKPGVALSQLVVLGPDCSKVAGATSYGVVVDGVDADFDAVVIKAGRGGYGMPGSEAAKGSGLRTAGGAGGEYQYTKTDVFSAPCDTKNHWGESGTSVQAYGRTANGGVGGRPGNSNCGLMPTPNNATDGGAGGKGDDGIEGSPGSATAADNGHFARADGTLHWVSAVTGGKGNDGSAGAGGGGGGVGGSWNVLYWCGVGFDVAGGGGHSGNAGGAGGGGGGGGHTGGGAIALVVCDAKVNAADLVLFGGQGGAGGTGRDGVGGVLGGQDDYSGSAGTSTMGCAGAGPKQSGGTGGSGGHGGKGGGGGGGAGGNGGPAFTLVTVGKGSIIEQGGTFNLGGGEPGTPGKGGHGADSKTTAPSGNPGFAATTIALELQG